MSQKGDLKTQANTGEKKRLVRKASHTESFPVYGPQRAGGKGGLVLEVGGEKGNGRRDSRIE